MKAEVVFLLSFIVSTSFGFSQGELQWGNNFVALGFRAPIYDFDPTLPGEPGSIHGQSPLSIPTGSTVYGGPLLQGTGYTFALFAGHAGATSNQLSFVASTTFRTATGNVLPAGLVLSSNATIPGVDAGQRAEFQIRVWANSPGVTDWASALALNSPHGGSEMVLSAPLGGFASNGDPRFFPTPGTVGWTSFSIGWGEAPSPGPEPSLFALSVLGMLLWNRARIRTAKR